MWGVYERFFQRCGVEVAVVEADGGAIGDLDNHEWMVLSPSGEDTILRCPACGYAANAERCPVLPPAPATNAGGEKPLEIVSTPGVRTVEEVAGMLGTVPASIVKTLLFVADGTPVAALIRGDREINEIKLKRHLGVADLALADAKTVERLTDAPVGFAGPSGLNGTRIVADQEVAVLRNFITGANQADAHFVHVNVGRDFTPSEFADVRVAEAGDTCPKCQDGQLETVRGIEVGHIFKLGTKYSKAMGATVPAEEDGTPRAVEMGCYGIGVPRTMAAIIEASHDENGIVWPVGVAPFAVVIVVANVKDAAQVTAAQTLHDELSRREIDVLLDDRDERAGVKFKDADLIGYPVRVVCGKGVANGVLEMRARRDAASGRDVPVADAADAVVALLDELRSAAPAPLALNDAAGLAARVSQTA